jgi:enamine deaminase RidA (YjgF/YER057c/UK114 family)
MPRRTVTPTPGAADAPGGVSRVVRFDQLAEVIFVAGQGPLEPDLTVRAGDFAAQTRATLENVRLELHHAGAAMDDVVDLTVYVSDIASQHQIVRDVCGEIFTPGREPATTIVETTGYAIDGIMVEIDAIATR